MPPAPDARASYDGNPLVTDGRVGVRLMHKQIVNRNAAGRLDVFKVDRMGGQERRVIGVIEEDIHKT
jgi:hypothetical protein